MSTAPHPNQTTPQKKGALLPTVLILLALALALVGLAQVWTDVLWFTQLGFERVFWTEWIARGAMFAAGFLLMMLAVMVSMAIAYRSRDTYAPLSASDRNLSVYRRQVQPYRKWIWLGVGAFSGFFLGTSLAAEWQTVLLWFNRASFGTVDPEFGYDVGFFVFTLPFLRIVVSALLTILVISGLASVAVHYLYGGITFAPKLAFAPPARVHTAVLGSLIAVVAAANLWLDRYSLLVAENSEKFSGAGFSAIHATMPGKAIMAGIALVVAVAFLVAAVKGWWKVPTVAIALMLVAAVVVGWGYPAFVQKFQVDPNAVEKESEYISRNIEATLEAYGLKDVETDSYSAETETEAGQLREDSESTASIRLLDPTIVDATFRQYQQSRQYYNFPDTLSVDRYSVDGQTHDTVIAVRELDQDGLDAEQRTWVNDHTVYTHGYGVVAAYGNQTASDGRPVFFEQGVPSSGLMGDYEQRIYFGESSPDYSIVGAPEGTEPWEFDYPDDSAENQYVSYTYTGDGGPNVGNFFNKVLYAIKFQSFNILFSDRVTSESQILYNRDPRERVAEVAPFLTLDQNVYPAVVDLDGDPDTPKSVVWIVDAYTTSNSYPYSARQELEDVTTTSLTAGAELYAPAEQINYIRNSVKAVVNAYDGSVTLYEWESDPVLEAWEGVFPGIITPTSEISADLMSHFRYPEDLFSAQREILTKYHVTDAASFYSGNDFWQVPADPTAGSDTSVKQPAYYMTLKMPSDDSAAFSLTTSFIPGGNSDRQILTGFLSVNADAGNEAGVISEDYGTLQLLELPRDLTVPGPGQVQNIFNANPTVSSELNLLQQQASQVLYGNLLTLPVGGGLLYVQPVYTQSSTGTQVPLLHRVLVAFGEEVGFAPTLGEALDQVFGGDSGAETADSGAAEPDGTGDDDAGGGTTSAEEKLQQALDEAAAAMQAANDAMTAGDWTAYGQAQDDLQAALEDAIAAEAEISGESGTADESADTTADSQTGDGGDS